MDGSVPIGVDEQVEIVSSQVGNGTIRETTRHCSEGQVNNEMELWTDVPCVEVANQTNQR